MSREKRDSWLLIDCTTRRPLGRAMTSGVLSLSLYTKNARYRRNRR